MNILLNLNNLAYLLQDEIKKYKELNIQCSNLRDDYKAKYRSKNCPLYLAKNPDLSLTPLVWRYSSMVKGSKGRRPVGCEFWDIVAKLSTADITNFNDFEYQRLVLNYQISTTAYNIRRLNILNSGMGDWSTNIRKNN